MRFYCTRALLVPLLISLSLSLLLSYVYKRFPDRSWICKPELAAQLYQNWMLGEVSVGGYAHALLLQPGAFARTPLFHDLPDVMRKVGTVAFVYVR